MPISFDIPDAFKPNLRPSRALRQWLHAIVQTEQKTLVRMHYTFMSDEDLLTHNIDFLQHDTYTDVITFDYCEANRVVGEAYISYERLRDNAEQLSASLLSETHRVLAHAILHLCGYGDKTAEEQKIMRAKEDYYLSLRPKILTSK